MSDAERFQANRHAREVLSGSQVEIGTRAAAPQKPAGSAPRLSIPGPESIGAGRAIFAACAVALLALGLVVYAVSGFGTASLIFFILALVLLAGRFVF